MSVKINPRAARTVGSTRILASAAFTAIAAICNPARAADGVWINTAGGSWPVTTNWLNGVADGSGATADFSTLDLGADATVTLDGARTVGKLIFGDVNPSNNWILNQGTAGQFTLAGTGAGVTVNNGTATVNAVIAGTDGLIKDGSGQLTLTANNTYTGGTTVNAGVLALNKGGSVGAIGGPLTINSGATVQLNASNATGYGATRVAVLNINGGLLNDVAAGDNLWGITINLTGGTMQSNGGTASATATQLFSLGGGSVVNSLASATTSVIAGRVNLREGNANNQLVFNVADGAADTDLLVSAALTQSGTPRSVVKMGAGTMVINNTLNNYAGGTIVNEGTLALTAGGGTGALKGTVTVNAGATIRSDVKDAFGYSGGANSVAILNINGGTVTHAGVGNNLTIWNEVVNMTGGLIQATDVNGQLDFGNGSTLNVLASSNVATIGGNRMNFRQDTNLFTVARGTAPTDLLITTALISDGGANRGFTKAGAGIVTMTGVNTYVGPTLVNAGTLALSGTASLSSNTITVADGALFDVSGLTTQPFSFSGTKTFTAGRTGTAPANDVIGGVNIGGGATLNVGGNGVVKTATFANALTLDSANIKMDLAGTTTAGNGVNDLISSGPLALSGTNSFVINAINGSLGNGTYTLMKYTGGLTGDAGNLALAGIGSGSTRQAFAFDTTTTPGSVLLKVSGNAAVLTWVGDNAANNWDLNQTPNWKNGTAPDKYFDLDRVLFDDTGSNSPDVQLAQAFSPGAITVDNSAKNYNFTGSGYISGLTGLTKRGTGTLTLPSNNDFTGPLVINNGVLVASYLANAGVASSLGAGSSVTLGDVATNGTLRYTGGGPISTDRSIVLNAGGGTIDITEPSTFLNLAGVVSGTGGLTTTGTGQITLAAANTYTGPTTIGAGILLKAGNNAAFGSGTAGVTVQPGATLDINGRNLSSKPITISGTGTAGQGALVNITGDQQNALNRLILAGDATVNSNARFDIRAGTTPTLDLAGHKLTKIGLNQFSLVNTTVTAGDIDVNEGTMSIEAASSFQGTGTITINSGARLGLYGNTAGSTTRNITLNNGTIANLGSNAILDSRITLADGTTNTITGPTATIIANGGVTGNGSLTIGPAVTFNTKAGDTIGGNLTIGDGSTNGATLNIAGNNTVGNFTINNGLTLNDATTLVFDLSNNPTAGNDKIVLGPSSSLSMSGITTIRPNLLNGMLGTGTYTLISGVNPGGGDTSNLALNVGASRQTLKLDTTTKPGSVLLNVTGTTASLVWSGAVSPNWDVNATQNWKNGANPDVFFNLDNVTLDDTATTGAIVLNQTATPGHITVNNSAIDYSISGTGTLGGAAALQKSGTGTLTFNSKQSYTGGTTVDAGTLALTVGGSTGALNGTLTVNPGATVRSDVKDSFGYGGGANQVNTLNINGGTVTHTSAADNLTLWGETINMTGGLLQSTGTTGGHLDIGNGTVVNVLASPNTATIGGTGLNLRQDTNLFTVAKGTAPVDLLVSAPITSDGTATRGVTKAGPGIMAISNTATYPGPTTVSGGTLSVSGSIASSSGVTVTDPAAVFEAAAAQRVKALTVTAGGARVVNAAAKVALTVGDGTQAASTLSLTGGKLDLTTNGLAVDYAAGNDAAVLASVRSQLIAGYHPSAPTAGDGKWDGATGITSAAAAANPLGAVGYALATDVRPFDAGATTDTFLGTTIDKSTVVARYTLSGDLNLDGSVDFLDLARLAQSYNVTDGTRQWANGDVNYDGNVDFLDLAKMAQNYNTALPTEPIAGAPADFQADLARAFAAVPEPGTISILGIGAAGLLTRRRRRTQR